MPHSIWTHPLVQASIVFLCGLIAILFLFSVAEPILFSVFVSMLLYAGLKPLVDYLSRHHIPRLRAISMTVALLVVALVALTILLLPVILHEVHDLSQRIATIHDRVKYLLIQFNHLGQGIFGTVDAEQLSTNIVNTISHEARLIHASIINYFHSISFSLLLIPIMTFYLLLDFRTLRNKAMQMLPNRYFELGWIVYSRTATQLQSYIRGILIQALLISALCTLGFWLVSVDFSPILGILVGLLNIIPVFGIFVAKILPVLAVTLSNSPEVSVILLSIGVIFIAQAVDTMYIIPYVVAKSANLHALTVMVAVVLGGYYGGFFGLILTVPVLFSMKVIYLELARGLKHFGTRARQEHNHIRELMNKP